MKKRIEHYTCIDCTAVAVSAGNSEPQKAVLVIDNRVKSGNQSLLFGHTTDDIDSLEGLLITEGWSSNENDLKSVVVENDNITTKTELIERLEKLKAIVDHEFYGGSDKLDDFYYKFRYDIVSHYDDIKEDR